MSEQTRGSNEALEVAIDSLFKTAMRVKRERDSLLKMLVEACRAIEEEVEAASPVDHPVIRDHARTARKARRLLAQINQK